MNTRIHGYSSEYQGSPLLWTTIWQVIINNKYNKSKKRYSTEKEIVRFTYIRLSLYSSSYLKGEKRWRAFPRAILVFAGAILTRCRWAQQYSQADLTNWGLYWSAQSETCSYDFLFYQLHPPFKLSSTMKFCAPQYPANLQPVFFISFKFFFKRR